jgi:aminoglycoside/choline kinase family phosphotransferase
MKLIVDFQALGRRTIDPLCIAFTRRFDDVLLRWELDHFREWLLENDRGVRLDAREAEIVDRSFDWLATTLAAEPPVLVHRDFQSRNLMLSGTPASLRLIDFQDALLGTVAYDLVALLRDSYVELDPSEVDEQVAAFAELAGMADPKAFRRLFFRQTLQRKLKDSGRFIFIDRVRRNPAFLKWIPASLRYVRDALPLVPEAGELAEVLARHVPELRQP